MEPDIFSGGIETSALTFTYKAYRDIYLGDKSTWDDESKIYFAVLRNGPAHSELLSSYIGMGSKNYARYWKRQILTGKTANIKLFATEEELVTYVKSQPGGIGYVSADHPPVAGLKIFGSKFGVTKFGVTKFAKFAKFGVKP